MKAIFKREFKSYFHSFMGWIYLAIMILATGIYSANDNFQYGSNSLTDVLSGISFLILMTIPIISMRIMSEERKNKTDQLILTAPVSVWDIVFGKFLSMVAIFAIPCVAAAFIPVILMPYGTIDISGSYISLLGYFLFGCTALAIGELISAMTENMILSALFTFLALFFCYIMKGICYMISASGNVLTKILGVFDIQSRFSDLCGSSLDIKAIIYFVTCILLLLYLTVQAVQKRRYSISAQGLKTGCYSVGMICASIALAVIVNLLVAEIPSKYTAIDCTSNKIYSLTDDTEKIIKNLDQDVTLYVLVGENGQDEDVGRTIDGYKSLSKHIKVVYKDPAISPQFFSQYTSTQPTSNSIIVVGPKRSKVIDYNSLYEQTPNYQTYQYEKTGYDAEGQITSAIAYTTTDTMPKIYMVTGHGEVDIDTTFTSAIAKENIDYASITLLKEDSIPEDAQAVIIDGPTSDFSTDDVKKVTDYLDKGGKVIIVPTFTDASMTNFETLFKYFGVSTVDGFIVEGNKDNYYSNPMYLIPIVDSDTMTSGLDGKYIFAPQAIGLSYDSNTTNTAITPLLSTSDSAFSRVKANQTSDSASKIDGDIDGPFDIAVKAVKTLDGDKSATGVIIGCQQMLTEQADTYVSGNNVKFFGDVLSELVEHEESVSIPSKSYDTATITANATGYLTFVLIYVMLIPLALIIAGIVVWYRRKKR